MYSSLARWPFRQPFSPSPLSLVVNRSEEGIQLVLDSMIEAILYSNKE